MSSASPAPPNFQNLAQQQSQQQGALLNQQTQANRPNQNNPYASTQWTQGPNGEWTQSSGFTGPLAGLNQGLQQQAAQAMGTPFSLGGLPALGSGEAAREQAINAAYGQATTRLDPAFSQREEATRTRLMQQGLQPGSEAYNREMEQLGRERTDAYGQAMSSAIGQGTAAGNALFQQNLASRGQALEELLRQRGQAMSELGGMQGLLGQQGFNAAGQGQAANLLGAGNSQYGADFQRWQADQQQLADMLGGGMQLAGTAASALPFLLSDERAKVQLQRLNEDVLPGVAAAVFRYHPDAGLGNKLYVGVSAQDLRRVLPSAVRERPDGLLEVHPAFAPLPLE